MNKSQIILKDALGCMLDKIDKILRDFNYQGQPIRMTLAGGMAVNYYCGTRYTQDVDATFSKKILLPYDELIVHYKQDDGRNAYIYFDTNYSPSLALMHEDYSDNVINYAELNNSGRLINLVLLSPIDLAISKIARFSDQDVDDILALASQGSFTADELKSRALDALSYYVGNIAAIETSIDIIHHKITSAEELSLR